MSRSRRFDRPPFSLDLDLVPNSDVAKRAMEQSYDDLVLISTNILERLYLRHWRSDSPVARRFVAAVEKELVRRDEVVLRPSLVPVR